MALMTYIALIYGPPAPPDFTLSPDAEKAWMEYVQAGRAANVYLGGHQLVGPFSATTVSIRDGKRVLSDGPFAETKEVLGGYCMLNCANLDEALDWAAKCPAAHGGAKIEVRPVVER
jgi:hypothetical protein